MLIKLNQHISIFQCHFTLLRPPNTLTHGTYMEQSILANLAHNFKYQTQCLSEANNHHRTNATTTNSTTSSVAVPCTTAIALPKNTPKSCYYYYHHHHRHRRQRTKNRKQTKTSKTKERQRKTAR